MPRAFYTFMARNVDVKQSGVSEVDSCQEGWPDIQIIQRKILKMLQSCHSMQIRGGGGINIGATLQLLWLYVYSVVTPHHLMALVLKSPT